jgi:hypothetical protein
MLSVGCAKGMVRHLLKGAIFPKDYPGPWKKYMLLLKP